MTIMHEHLHCIAASRLAAYDDMTMCHAHFSRNQKPDIQIVRAATCTCSRNHACAGSSFKRGCHVMKYGNGLISLGGSTKRTPSIRRTSFVSFRGTVRTRSVFATANIAAAKNGTLRTTRRFAPN